MMKLSGGPLEISDNACRMAVISAVKMELLGASDPFEGESPEIKGLLEKAMELENEIQAAIASSKATSAKQTEIRQHLMEIMKIIVQQQVMIGHLMGRLSTESKD
ncbi:hypothetical protein AVEN_3635-1 [Araneus ventricosus]|uniref:Uncharacterized protein n=1 Tax=Araneus ventricosus TaxID=182803 RepID=A0A4Y2IF21_ARAVE|nr:hypothetical protein AVEN_3635-1 [Araneus ventricosus]